MFARTQRLMLRPGWAEDATALHLAIADEQVVRNLARAPWPYALADARAFLADDREPRLPACLIFERTDAAPALVGGIGLHRDEDGAVEFGYWITRARWGMGYATEAGHALLGAARHSLRVDAIVSSHFADNPASGRVLRKLGFAPTGRVSQRHGTARGTRSECVHYALDEAHCCADPERPMLENA